MSESGAVTDQDVVVPTVEPTGDRATGGARKTLLHVAYPLWRKQLLLAVARAKQLQSRGVDVVATYCSATRGTCAVNYAGSPVTCAICRHRVKQTLQEEGIRAVPLTPITRIENETFPLSERRETAEGVHSGMITAFRTMQEDSRKNRLLKTVKRQYFRHVRALLHQFKNALTREAPDAVEVFNGRHACSRLVLTAARGAKIPFNTIEVTTSQKPIVFSGHLVHDRKSIQRRILQNDANMELAEEFYANRRRPRANKFAKKHAAEFQPPSSNGFQRKISIFLSSQDEFESLGKDWESPFLDYAPIVRRAVEAYPNDLFCVRFHPNQADMVTDVTAPFRELETLPNVVMYYPEDTANTYTLVDWSDIVVTFGSTVSIEACWVGKPVILLGPSFYDSLGVAYTPDSVDEFVELLGQTLEPGSRENAARFATFELTDHDPIDLIAHKGGKMVADGVFLKLPWLSQAARTSDDLFCHAVKFCTAWSSRSDKKAA